MKKTILFYLLLAFMSSFAQQEMTFPIAKPETVGLSSDRINLLKPLLQGYVDDNKLPGMITMVARHGKVINFDSYGIMGTDKPMQLDAIFRIASMTKPITSVAVMMLYEEGRFKLDDPVAKYIPELKDLKVFSSKDKNGIHLEDQKRPMTISDLLTHTSGLGSGVENTYVDSVYRSVQLSDGTLKDMILKLAKIPLLYQPGTKWKYGRSSDVLAYLVEVISGQPLDQFFKERIFIPLKMKDTGYYVPNEKTDRVSSVYSVGNKLITDTEVNNVTTPVKFFSGNGGLLSTATDYMIFSQMLLNKGKYKGIRLLKRTTVDLMSSIHVSNATMPDDDFFGPLMKGMGFGYGFAVVQDNLQSNTIGSKGSYWWAGAGNTYFYIDPKEELILILMTQFVPSYYYPINKEFRELVYKSIVD
jgi:CubicO group peptidase (beta-lactamase class C family)